MSKYVDGFVLVVPKDKKDEYKNMAMGVEILGLNMALYSILIVVETI